jgi:hypothetical protein
MQGGSLVSGRSFLGCSKPANAYHKIDADDADDPVVKRGRKDNTYTLDMGDDGFPILPDHAEMDSDTRKAVVRAFLNWHYRESANVNGPGELTAMDRGLQRQTERPGSLEGGHSKARRTHPSPLSASWVENPGAIEDEPARGYRAVGLLV